MAFISEIHYQNVYAAASGITEFVEVALTAAEYAEAANYTIATYQVDGAVADSISLDQLTPVYDASLDIYTYTFETPVTSPDHSPGGDTGAGEAEAVSLVNTATNEVISFYDIGGGTSGITAVEGPAVGAVSTNVAGASPGSTIQFDPYNNRIDDDASVGAQPYILLEISGAQVGSYASASSTGNGDDLVLTLDGTEALGDASDTYTLVVTQTNGSDFFNNGQFVSLVDGNGNVVFQNAGVNNDAYQGRGGGDPYLVLSNGYVLDLRGLPSSPASVDYTLADDVIGDPYLEPYGELNFDDVINSEPIPCFTAGTLINTLYGDRPVEDLQVGDLVLTKDNGYQPIVWTGIRQVIFPKDGRADDLRPIRISQSAAPSNPPLVVSPQHRIMVSGPVLSLLSGETEALVSAEHLRKCGAAQRVHGADTVDYHHFMLKQHELVLSNGRWTESLDPHFLFSTSGGNAEKREILSLFSSDVPLQGTGNSCARPVLRGYEVCALFAQQQAAVA